MRLDEITSIAPIVKCFSNNKIFPTSEFRVQFSILTALLQILAALNLNFLATLYIPFAGAAPFKLHHAALNSCVVVLNIHSSTHASYKFFFFKISQLLVMLILNYLFADCQELVIHIISHMTSRSCNSFQASVPFGK